MLTHRIPIIIIILFLYAFTANAQDITEKYWHYRDRVLNEFIFVSADVEEFGTNIPAIDRKHDTTGKAAWISWSDGNSNFNHWLGVLSTEYRLLKNNGEDYSETLHMLVYSLLAIERLDLYSEYAIRKRDSSYLVRKHDSINEWIVYPDDINGFLIRDDVSLGFWLNHCSHFGIWGGWLNKTNDGTNTYLSVFQNGVIPQEGQSQDNIIRLLHGLAIVKQMMDTENISDIHVNFINNMIPMYLNSKNIISNDSVYFNRWVDDLTSRLVKQMQHPFPEQEMVLKPLRGMAEPSKHRLFGVLSSRWYILNPVNKEVVAEGSGEDMGVWMNSYGIAEAAAAITGIDTFHFDGSRYGLSNYLFKAFLMKQLYLFPSTAIPLPRNFDDYMFRDLAAVADINWHKNSKQLFHTLRDRREGISYDHQIMILYLLHKDKYQSEYNPQSEYYAIDKKYFKELLESAPKNGPHNNADSPKYVKDWSTSSRMIWPGESKRTDRYYTEYAGLDYMYMHNLYRLIFEPKAFSLPSNRTRPLSDETYIKKSSYTPDYEAWFYYEAPKAKMYK